MATTLSFGESYVLGPFKSLWRRVGDRWLSSVRASVISTSRDAHPWKHPYLSTKNIQSFRSYSEEIWSFALSYATTARTKLRSAFSVNMAQNMYKWARLAKQYGADATLFLHAMDNTALNTPQWEEFDGEYSHIFDGNGFLAQFADVIPEVPWERIPLDSTVLANAYSAYQGGHAKPLLRLMSECNGMRHEVFSSHPSFFAYYDWAKALSQFDVIYAASAPFAAYASGRPYCLFSVGGDLQFDCGRGDWFGQAMTLAFNGGRFLMISNPHTLGHSRRLGLTNGVYLPYPMDTERYCPGFGSARAQWDSEYGPGIYVLTTARLDSGVKGHGDEFFRMLASVAQERPNLRFIFLAWGHSADEFKKRIQRGGLQKQLIVLAPVGKKRLINYYRSCDAVLDQFVYGYYGATALEAASIGKPVVMKIHADQYSPLYADDVAPVMNVSTPAEIRQAILSLADSADLRTRMGEAMRNWVVRNHGEAKTTPLLLALLRLAADRVPLPTHLVNPLCEPESEDEIAYHQSCLQPAP